MKNDWLCKCKHSKQDHLNRDYEQDGIILFRSCDHDRGAIFKGMCHCGWYCPMSNLEYLEWEIKDEKTVL